MNSAGTNLTSDEITASNFTLIGSEFSANVGADIENYHVFIEGNSGGVWGGAENYLLDVSYEEQVDTFLP